MKTTAEFKDALNQYQHDFDAMSPELEVTVRDPSLDLEGHVVVWNTEISRGGPLHNCAKGGTRIRTGLTLDEVKMLAKNMALKNAAASLPLGGCKSGICADPKSSGFEKKYRRFVELCKPFTHENGGLFGGFGFDIGAAPEHALWACDTLQSTRSFTGKPINMGGTDYDKEGIAGLGVAVAALETLRAYQQDVQSAHFTVHGLGAMGSAVVKYFSGYGGKLMALGDPKYGGTWIFEQPASQEFLNTISGEVTPDNEKLIKTLLERESRHISSDPNEVLSLKTDVLFPCATQYVINSNNIESLKCRYIIEGANNPTEVCCYELTFNKNIIHVPDFIANSGGVIAAFVELTSVISNEENYKTRGKVEEAKSKTYQTIKDNIHTIVNISKQYKVSLRDAGLFFAFKAIFLDSDH